jgi:Cu(I)/Ag(I) efflux system membrane fusion protein
VSAATGSPNRPQLLGRAARQRLHLFGLSDVQIEALAKRGAPEEDVVIAAPASGFVIEKNVVEGASVEPGMRLFRIAALSKVWVEAEVYEADLAHVRVGQRVTVTLDYLPERAYEASVAYVYPYLDMKTRTGRFRVELVNQQLELRPGMYASIELGSAEETRVQVPAAAVVYTGPRRLVFVDLGQGRFRPQEIRVGSEANGMYEVIAGLSPGDMVATSGVFLIAAEARISTAAKYWDDLSVSDQEHAPPTSGNPASGNPAAASGPHAEIYSCPMHPEVQSSTPGTCPKCGMALEPHGEKGAP